MPDYDSGWIEWQPPHILNHNLGTKELFVYVMYKNNEDILQPNTMLVQWRALNDQSILVGSADLSPNERFRIIIWKLMTLFNNFLFGSENPM